MKTIDDLEVSGRRVLVRAVHDDGRRDILEIGLGAQRY